MKMKTLLCMLLIFALLLTGCGGAAKNTAYRVEEMAPQAPMAMAMDAAASLTTYGATGSGALPENRKWIVTVDMNAETDDLDTMLTNLDSHILSLNGYVEDQSIYNGSSYADRRYRNANLTVRIPADVVDQFTEEVAGIANVVRKQTSKEDVTLQYVDTESRKAALETEQKRLMELLAQAETMSDLLEIEGRLTEVRYQLESAASQLRTYDNRIDYATVHLYIEEVQEYTPIAEKTVWQRITEGFSDSVEELGESLVDLFVWLIVASPFILVYGGILVGLALLFKAIRKKHPGRKCPFRKRKAESSDTPSE